MLRLFSLITSFVADDAKSLARRAKRSAAVLALAGVLGFTSYIFIMAALAFWLAGPLGPIGATLTIACITALATAGLLVWLRAQERAEKRRREAAKNAKAMRLALMAGSAAAASKSKGLLGLAAIVGIAFMLFSGKNSGDAGDSEGG